MAESKDDLDKLMCSICVDVYREPVSLPCSHSYCRQCLHMFVDRAKDSEEDLRLSDTDGNTSGHVIISCPVCRSSTNMGPEGVAGLPINRELADAVNSANDSIKEVQAEDSGPTCSMCEGDKKSAAVTVCSNCQILYCEECLATLHPMRGPLRRHTLISVEDYLSQQTAASVDAESETNPDPKCSRHSEAFSIYCMTCQELMCLNCLPSHNEHSMVDLSWAHQKLKVPFLETIRQSEEVHQWLLDSAKGFDDLDKDIQENENRHKQEIGKVYDMVLKRLETWKKNSLDEVGKRHIARCMQCRASSKDLRMKAKEVDSARKAATDLASATITVFLQGSAELTNRLGDQQRDMMEVDHNQDVSKQQVVESLKSDPVTPIHVVFEEPSGGDVVSWPLLKFRKHGIVKITGDCLKMEHKISEKYQEIETDRMFQHGRYFWQIDVTFDMTAAPTQVCKFEAGVKPQGSWLAKSPEAAWGFLLKFSNAKVTCSRLRGCRGVEKNKYVCKTFPLRLGFYLNCEKRTLTSMDCDQQKVLCTVFDVDVSQSLMPVFGFSNSDGSPLMPISAQLVSGDFFQQHVLVASYDNGDSLVLTRLGGILRQQ